MKDDFANLETEKVGRKIKKTSDSVSLLVRNFIDEHDEISSVLKKNNNNIIINWKNNKKNKKKKKIFKKSK